MRYSYINLINTYISIFVTALLTGELGGRIEVNVCESETKMNGKKCTLLNIKLSITHCNFMSILTYQQT